MFPEIDIEKFEEIMVLFDQRKLKDVKRYAKKMTLWENEFVSMIVTAQRGLKHYKYQTFYWEDQSEHLQLSEEQEVALNSANVGPLEGDAKKAVRKIFQMFKQRKWVVGHLFYTEDLSLWHLFYFDIQDLSESENHWSEGRHAHYVSSLWPQHKLPEVWEKFCSKSKDIGGSVHIRFRKNETDT